MNCNSHAPQGTKRIAFLFSPLPLLIATHTPHRGRNAHVTSFTTSFFIATHTPHRGRNIAVRLEHPQNALQLTRPTGDETVKYVLIKDVAFIATHTPHRGRNKIKFASS